MRRNRSKERALTSVDYEKYNFRSDTKDYEVVMDKGLNENVVRQISKIKKEPKWMLDYRLNALEVFRKLPMPKWGGNLSEINLDEIVYYMKPSEENKQKWEEVPEYIKETFERLGVPQAERKFLGGVSSQYESEVVYHSIREELEKQGVIFLGMDQGLKEYEDVVREHFGTVVPTMDNKFAALNSAVWSGGSFIFLPKNVKVDIPLQAYFRINAQNMGQFERTLIIVDKGAQVHYIEGCFTKGTSILTEEGMKPIENVKVGEKVWTHKNRLMPVYHTQIRKYSGKLFEIECFGDFVQKIETTEEHPFLCIRKERLAYKNKSFELQWVKTADIEKGDYLVIPINKETKSIEKFARIISGYKTNEVGVGKLITVQKLRNVKITDKYAFVPIRSIKSSNVKEINVYNFSVKKDESYIANGVAVHNCTAPTYSSNSLHAAVVEVIAKEDSTVRYTTIQNWSNNIYNLVTKRATAAKNAKVYWVDGNLGSKQTMKYPSIYLKGEGAKAEILSVALAAKGQHQDAGAKAVHLASNTTSTITSKSVSKDGGRSSYRGLLKVARGCKNVKSNVMCDALLLDKDSRSDTYPTIEIDEPTATIAHEARVGKIGQDQIFYLMSRGLSEQEALTMIVLGFISPFIKELPMEYAIELNRLIEMEMEGCVG